MCFLAFDLSFSGNHDEIIGESLLADSPLNCPDGGDRRQGQSISSLR